MKHRRVFSLLIVTVTFLSSAFGKIESGFASVGSDNNNHLPAIFQPADIYSQPSQSGFYPTGQNSTDWTLTFNDEFDGTALDRNKWRTDYWNGGNGELQEYVNDDSHNNYIVQNGILSIVARKEYYNGKNYTSGSITTQDRFFQKYGFFELRTKMPRGKGLWPSWWTMPNPTGWPPEIDVMEYLGHEPNVAYLTLHYKNSSGAHAQNQSYYIGPDFSTGYHTFGAEWRSDAIIWYVDGVERKRITDPSIIPNMSMFLLVNLAVGGSWPGSPDSSTVFPASMDIDYVRVWQKATTTNPTPLPTGNMIGNPSFEDTGANPWTYPWVTRNDLGATFTQDSTTSVGGKYSFKGTLTAKNTTQPWVVALMQKDKQLNAGQAYTLSFWAKASNPWPLTVIVQEENSPYTEYSKKTVSLNSSWAKYVHTFTAPTTTANTQLNLNLAAEVGSIWIDEVWICPGTTDCSSSVVAPTPTSTSVAPTPTPTATPIPTATPTQQSDTIKPNIAITYPADNSTVKRKSTVTIAANASDDKGIAKVEFRVNSSLLCTDSTAPYSCVWNVPKAPGVTYTIKAKAYDLSGNTNISTVTVKAIR